MRRALVAALTAVLALAVPLTGYAQLFPTPSEAGGEPKPTGEQAPAQKPGELVNWLDSPRHDWNLAGAAVPSPGIDISIVGCEAGLRPAETPEDEAVVAAGWRLGSPYRAAWGVKVIEGIAWLDGMCRPIRYQEFVFVDGVFAGTIAPDLMSSRAGDPGRTEWFNKETLTARFVRFRPGDSFCCPSGEPVMIYFKVNRTDGGPVLQLSRS